MIKGSYEKPEDVPQEFKDSYTEVDGKFMLTGSIDVKNSSEYKDLHEAKKSSFDEMHSLKEKVKEYDQSKSSMENELITLRELNKNGGQSEETMNAIVEQRLAVELKQYKTKEEISDSKIKELEGYKFGNELNSQISDLTKEKFAKEHEPTVNYLLKNNSERQADGIYLTKEVKEFGIDAGMTIEQAVSRLTEKQTTWLPQNSAGQANSSKGTNKGASSNAKPTMKDLMDEVWSK